MALFIGGPLDGSFVDVDPDRIHIEIAVNQPISDELVAVENKEPIKSLTNIFYYKREILSCPTNNFLLYVPRNFKCEDVMLALVNGYHQAATQLQEP